MDWVKEYGGVCYTLTNFYQLLAVVYLLPAASAQLHNKNSVTACSVLVTFMLLVVA